MSAQPASSNVIEVERVLGETHHPAFQLMLLVLCGLCLVIDGFDAQAMGYVPPSVIAEWNVSKAALGPLVGGQMIALSWSNAALFHAAAVPVLCSALLVIVLAGATRHHRAALAQTA